MVPTTFHLIVLQEGVSEAPLLSVFSNLAMSSRPLYIGRCQHWIHAPHLSATTLTGSGATIKRWDYLLINRASNSTSLALSDGLGSLVESNWSITADVDDAQLANYTQAQRNRLGASAPPLPTGWAPNDHSGLDAAVPPTDLEASLALSAHPLGSRIDTGQEPIILKDFVRGFGMRHTGAVDMFNLLSYLPNQRPRYFEYIAAFRASVGSKYGGDAMFLGLGVSDWSSKADETTESRSGDENASAGWEDIGLIYYPSIWHFGKMLDDPRYMDADRRYKQGVLRDNPILCCTEVDVSRKD